MIASRFDMSLDLSTHDSSKGMERGKMGEDGRRAMTMPTDSIQRDVRVPKRSAPFRLLLTNKL